MFRLSRITDYGIRVLAHLASSAESGLRVAPVNAREVADELSLPLPIVSKVMKSLARAGLLESHRGSKGGFNLVQRPEDLSVADMIAALEGPVALTECQIGPFLCQHEGTCSVQEPWSVINRSVRNTLATITLSDLIDPLFPLIQVTSSARAERTPPQ